MDREWPAPFKPAIPQVSEMDALRDCKRVIDLNAQVAHCAFELGVPQRELSGSQVTGLAIDQCRFRAAQGVGAVGCRIQTDQADPASNDPSVLAGR